MSAIRISKLSDHSDAPSQRPEEIDGHPQAVTRALERPFEHRIDSQLFRCGERIGVLVEISAHRACRAHDEPAGLTQSADRRIRDAEPKVVLLGAERLERQYRQ